MNAAGAPLVFAVSDATGGTAEAAAKAALAQFAGVGEVRLRLFPHVLDRRAIETLMAAAQLQGALVVYTIVEPDLRSHVKSVAEDLEVPAVDLLGPLVNRLAQHLDRVPLAVPGLGHTTDAEYFRRIDAVEFTVRNDDGKEPRNLRRADIVVVGISRTGKTPLCHYVAQRGFKAANVPLVLDVPLPPDLEEVDPRRVFGLTIDPAQLMKIRQTRILALGMAPGTDYGEMQHIRRELEYARKVFAEHPGWTVIDITRKAVEETATTVLQAYRESFEPGEPPPLEPRPPAATLFDLTPAPAPADEPVPGPQPPKTPSAKTPTAKVPPGKSRPKKGV